MLCTREVTVQVPDGLHHQTAARFIQTANRFTSVVRVVYGDNNVNAKSLLGVLSLSIGAGTRITITADGADAGEALDALGAVPCRGVSLWSRPDLLNQRGAAGNAGGPSLQKCAGTGQASGPRAL